MPNEIPDGMDETPLHPKTVEGKIMEMRDIGVDLIESTDALISALETLHPKTVEGASQNDAIRLMSAHIMRLTTLSQLQTDTITQLYGELRGPGW